MVLPVLGSLLSIVVLALLVDCQPSPPDEVQHAYENLPDKVDFNFHIKPILSDRCCKCHGPDLYDYKH
jgi:hypothetical protein